MIEWGAIPIISTILRIINDLFSLGTKASDRREKKRKERSEAETEKVVHDEVSFLALIDAERNKKIRVIDPSDHNYEFSVYVQKIELQHENDKRGINCITFQFKPAAEGEKTSLFDNHSGYFDKKLIVKAKMLSPGDKIKIRGRFKLDNPLGMVTIEDIERIIENV